VEKMKNFDRKKRWEHIYKTKRGNEVSWYEVTPATSLEFIHQCKLSKQAKIIDIGGGDCVLVDYLLDQGFQDISVLDISKTAIEGAKKRLRDRADRVKWIVADVAKFQPTEKYDFWHDRAAFHFLTDEQEISSYLETAQQCIKPAGFLVLGTFSEQGPGKCSGMEVKQYSENSMTERLIKLFEKIRCVETNHTTPFNTIQNFIFCSFRPKLTG
jgi:2-polyprenyl-3-methyl-5-hydroxy-6-metoxy-1,4-benzoquinol methylase